MQFERKTYVRWLGLLVWGILCVSLRAEPVEEREFFELVRQLNAPDWALRETASAALRRLWERIPREHRATWLRRALADPPTWEQLERSQAMLRSSVLSSAAALAPAELDSLMQELESSSFATRQWAAQRLEDSLANPANIAPCLERVKAQLTKHELAATAKDWQHHYRVVRTAWLRLPAEKEVVPVPSGESIAAWLSAIDRPVAQESPDIQRRVALRELEDVLMHERAIPLLRKLLAAQLSRTTEPAALRYFSDLFSRTRPAVVAEIFVRGSERRNPWGLVVLESDEIVLDTSQYLVVGVPQFPLGGERATHFDRADDKTVHCASGNTLLPGDYPTGVGVPHPQGRGSVFHLFHLPTPRDVWRHEQWREAHTDSELFAELSEKTCAHFLATDRPLGALEAQMLTLVDPDLLSDFAGKFFAAREDRKLTDLNQALMVGRTSMHGALCYAVALRGTSKAAGAILTALEKNRFLPTDATAPYDLPRLALLSLARRDPWETADPWLAQQVKQTLPLVMGVDPAPDLGATAASVLAARRGIDLEMLSLIPIEDGFTQVLGSPLYRWKDEAARQKGQAWAKSLASDDLDGM